MSLPKKLMVVGFQNYQNIQFYFRFCSKLLYGNPDSIPRTDYGSVSLVKTPLKYKNFV